MLESEHFWRYHLPHRLCDKILPNSTLGEDYLIALEVVWENLVHTISAHNYVNKSEF